MKFQPARHTSAPHSREAGKYVSVSTPGGDVVVRAPFSMSLTVQTSGDGGGAIGVGGATHALPIVEKDIGSQKMWTPRPA
jgi:hypothetical protein